MLQKQGFFSTLFLYRTQVIYFIRFNIFEYCQSAQFQYVINRCYFEKSPIQHEAFGKSEPKNWNLEFITITDRIHPRIDPKFT